jgi:hypothetical protein
MWTAECTVPFSFSEIPSPPPPTDVTEALRGCSRFLGTVAVTSPRNSSVVLLRKPFSFAECDQHHCRQSRGKGKGKGKVHHITGHEGPEGE